MKDFTINKNEKEKYIKNVRKIKKLSGQECYEITYADGRKFRNITCCEENLKKIEKAQEEQATKAFANKGIFEKKERKYKFSTLTGVLATSLASAAPLNMIIHGTLTNSGSHILDLSIGTVCAGATLFSLFNYLKNRGKVAELNKINYRNTNMETLSTLNNYENSLTGLNKFKQEYFKNTKNPFSIMKIENFSQKDLEAIMSNIDREKEYNFEYNKKKAKSKETATRTK